MSNVNSTANKNFAYLKNITSFLFLLIKIRLDLACVKGSEVYAKLPVIRKFKFRVRKVKGQVCVCSHAQVQTKLVVVLVSDTAQELHAHFFEISTTTSY